MLGNGDDSLTALQAPVPAATVPVSDLAARATESALQGLSDQSRRIYRTRIRDYLQWSGGTQLDREHVRRYLRSLELAGSSPQVRNQALAALKRFATEAGELGWIDPAAALQIERVKSSKVRGTKTGRWLTATQATALLASVDRTTTIGRRDACVMALLLGCGLRRDEAVRVQVAQLRTVIGPQGRMIVENLIGKGGRTRSVSVPRWAQRDIEWWIKELNDE
jgi:site-specific recombinase XerD